MGLRASEFFFKIFIRRADGFKIIASSNNVASYQRNNREPHPNEQVIGHWDMNIEKREYNDLACDRHTIPNQDIHTGFDEGFEFGLHRTRHLF